MSHVRHCPEFQLPRSDSKNPATTCRGLTADGRRCRRTVKVVPPTAYSDQQKDQNGKSKGLAVQRPAELFCWQHEAQAGTLTSPTKENVPSRLHGRSSLDTLVERVGLLNVDDGERPVLKNVKPTRISPIEKASGSRSGGVTARASRRNEVPPRTRVDERLHKERKPVAAVVATNDPKPKKKSKSRTRLVCFLTDVDDDDDGRELAKNRKRLSDGRTNSYYGDRVAQTPPKYSPQHRTRPATAGNETSRHRPNLETSPQHVNRHRSSLPTHSKSTSLSTSLELPQSSRPSTGGRRASSQTESLLSWIPSTLSPETTSKLLQKLSEPLSAADEPGYIYIYCATPHDSQPLAEQTPSLFPPPERTNTKSRRTSDVMRSAGITPTSQLPKHDPRHKNSNHTTTNTITLKIGRAVNVSRRLTQQQCLNNLTLVRYYPYYPSSNPASSGVSSSPNKAPNVHRLERLVHLELGDIRVKPGKPCEQCGKRHQEYFEIEADKEQLRMVDECVRRWVEYSLRHPNV